MCHLQVEVADGSIAYQTQAVGTNGYGGVLPNAPSRVEGRYGGCGAVHVGAVCHLQVGVGEVSIANQGQAVGTDGYGGV